MFKYGYENYVRNHCEFSHVEEVKGIVKEIYYDANGRKYTLTKTLTSAEKGKNIGYAFFPSKEQRERYKQKNTEGLNKQSDEKSK